MANHTDFRKAWSLSGLVGKTWVRIAGAIVALFILVIVVVPLFVGADTFRPAAEAKISSAIGRQVTLGHLSFSLLSGSLVADNVAIADDPTFSATPFFEAKSLHIGVGVAPLLFHRQLSVTNFTADSPEIHLISKPNGDWNYSSLGRGAGASNSQAGGPNVSVGELKIKNGAVDVSSLPATGKPLVYDHMDLTVKHLSYTTPMPFDLTADLPAGGSVKLTGTAGPIAQPDATNTPFQAALEIKHFDPVAGGVIAPNQGISMVADLSAQVVSNGKTVTTSGKMEATGLKLSPHGSPAPKAVDLDLATTHNLATRGGQVSDLALHTGAVAAHVSGTYQLTGQAVTVNLHLTAPSLPIDGLEQLLPAVGIRLPSGSSLHGGTVTANFDITGPASAPRIAGPVEIDNTQLAGFALASKIEGWSPGGGNKSSGTSIRQLKTDLVSTPQSTDFSNIYGDVPGIGTATGSGTVSAAGALNFQMLAKLGSSGGGSGGVMNAAGGLLNTATAGGVPLTITGTTSSPSIHVNMGAMMKKQAAGLLGGASGAKKNVTGLAKGLFHK